MAVQLGRLNSDYFLFLSFNCTALNRDSSGYDYSDFGDLSRYFCLPDASWYGAFIGCIWLCLWTMANRLDYYWRRFPLQNFGENWPV